MKRSGTRGRGKSIFYRWLKKHSELKIRAQKTDKRSMKFARILTFSLVFCSTISVSAETVIEDILGQANIVFLGENHCKMEHKRLAFEFIQKMGVNAQIDTFIFEMGEYKDSKILQDYFDDSEATAGSL